ncbi:hypothetical protein HPB51_009273 [Rhipicephalus microplus]|uniref:C2H2-type domain-containing protein n=1 Tax=Rhipicephalus microplus TaxID=6941 RepID=A0A9J6F0K3_RHIMP|nr:hypothetical protein HPB51_009273 [Rhipicephalus microplus]
MQQHSREAHRGDLKPHQCTQCLKSFSSTHQLAQHARIHTGEKPYKCSYCERRFKQLSHVQQHTRLHTGERPYKCHVAECGRAFIQLSNLQQHLRNHDSQMERAKSRPFHCNICGKGFASDSSLRTHRSKQHAALIGGAASQSCPICHKICVNAEALMEHMRISHKDPPATAPVQLQRITVEVQWQYTIVSFRHNVDQWRHFRRHSVFRRPRKAGFLQHDGSAHDSADEESSVADETSCPLVWPQVREAFGADSFSDFVTLDNGVVDDEELTNEEVRATIESRCELSSYDNEQEDEFPCSKADLTAGLLHHMEHMRMDPKHQFAAQYLLSRAAAERREKHGGPSAGPPHDMLSAIQPQPQAAALAAVMQPPPSSLAVLQASHLAHS